MAEDQKNQKKDFIFAVGRRREAVARVRLWADAIENIVWREQGIKKGDIFVNQKPIESYFSGKVSKARYEAPLRLTNTLGKYTLTIRVVGGGKHGQLAAIQHGIARALSAFDSEKFRSLLKKHGFLTRDARVKERRKVGTGGKARRKRQSPKR